jgi:hypothetical protein
MKTTRALSSFAALALFVGLAASAQAAPNFKYSERSLLGAYAVRLTPATSFAPFDSSSGIATAPRQDILRVGVLSFDGKGNVSGRFVATTDTNAGDTQSRDFKFTGTYTVDSDGFGEMTITPAAGTLDEGTEIYSLKVNARVKSVLLIQKDNDGGGAKIFLTGEAIVDRPIGDLQ